jgi:hypothetical protein
MAQLEPQQTGDPEWVNHPEWFQPQAPQTPNTPLPRKLTPALLTSWRISDDYYPMLIRCQTDEDLLAAEVPAEVLGRVMDALWPPPASKIAAQPDQVLFQPKDLEKYAEGTLRGFLRHLDEDHNAGLPVGRSKAQLWSRGVPAPVNLALYRLRTLIKQALEQGQARWVNISETLCPRN